MARALLTLAILQILLPTIAHAQEGQRSLLPYLYGVRTNGALALNIRGYELIADKAAGNLSKPHFATMFPGFQLHQGYSTTPDNSFGLPVFRVQNRRGPKANASGYSIFYFIQKNSDTVLGISMAGIRQPELDLERSMISLIINKTIPDSQLSDMQPPMKLQLAGRSIPVGDRCRWMGPTTLQCPGFGEMNWSLHPDMAEAEHQTATQKAANTQNRRMKVEQETEVPIFFEGVPVTAQKLQYRVKGVTGLLTKMEGSRTLIVYYVTAPVRGRYVSCVLSHWTSDYIAENGLPPLLGTVMSLR